MSFECNPISHGKELGRFEQRNTSLLNKAPFILQATAKVFHATIKEAEMYQLSDGRTTADFWIWYIERRKINRLEQKNIFLIDEAPLASQVAAEVFPPFDRDATAYKFSDGTTLADFLTQQKINQFEQKEAFKVPAPIESLRAKNENHIGQKVLLKWKFDYRNQVKLYRNVNRLYDCWEIRRKRLKPDQLSQLNIVSRIDHKSSQLDGKKRSLFYLFKIYTPEQDRKSQEVFFASLIAEIPEIKLKNLTKKQADFFVVKVFNVKIEKICNFFVTKGDFSKEDSQNYLTWLSQASGRRLL